MKSALAMIGVLSVLLPVLPAKLSADSAPVAARPAPPPLTPEQAEIRAVEMETMKLSTSTYGFGKEPAASAASVDWDGARDRLLAIAAKYPNAYVSEDIYMYGYEASHTPAQAKAQWAYFAASPNKAMADQAKAKVKFHELIERPVDLVFTAVDGRLVDTKQLRGKVVMVDFWATWCGPCKAELPNVTALYNKYHDQGFEIVSIACENLRAKPTDTPEEHAAKIAAARKVLTDYTSSHAMPWPQYFSETGMKNEFADRYEVHAIPETLILGKDGVVIQVNALGKTLEATIKKGLGI